MSVVGVPDRRFYEEICVCFVTNSECEVSPTDVKQFCMEKFIGHRAVDGLGEIPYESTACHCLTMEKLTKDS
jgi:hypothetical protein